ncbi:hypothetical protein [Amycolatopsis rhizosphaerae]|uniref:hypothetical protein n=1 Tax=Amycolatopsis rhizosphaerae TaxID=2053003 RepID=UPI001C943C42|nr:hypothetical protein [Amycolatopsis rhizosphaerae]
MGAVSSTTIPSAAEATVPAKARNTAISDVVVTRGRFRIAQQRGEFVERGDLDRARTGELLLDTGHRVRREQVTVGADDALTVRGALADDPARRRRIAVGGYAATAGLAASTGAAASVWQVGLRAGAWAARGLRVPARNALLADVVPAGSYGRRDDGRGQVVAGVEQQRQGGRGGDAVKGGQQVGGAQDEQGGRDIPDLERGGGHQQPAEPSA